MCFFKTFILISNCMKKLHLMHLLLLFFQKLWGKPGSVDSTQFVPNHRPWRPAKRVKSELPCHPFKQMKTTLCELSVPDCFLMLTGSKWWNTFFLSLPGHPQYTGSVQQGFENTNISLPSVAFLSDDIKNQLQDISTEAKKFDFTAIMQQVCLFLCGSLTVIRWLCVYMLK